MMKNRSRATACGSRFLCAALIAVCLVLGTATVAQAKSLYVIAEVLNLGGSTPIQAYNIGPGGILTYQTEYGIRSRGGGTVGLAIDSLSQSLFVTYEASNEIQVLNPVTMQESLVAIAPGAVDLAGIVYDHDKKLLYCVDREEPNLYVYRWDPDTGRLNSVLDSPFKLTGMSAYGIALDEIDDQLYVGNSSRDVTVYNTADWSLARTIALRRSAVSVAVDPKRHYLYTGAGFADIFYLTQYDLATGAEAEVLVDPNAGVMGLAVDPATGLVYVTTGRNNRPGGDDLLVFDTHLTLIQTIEDIGNPTGVAIPGKETSYNPLHLVKVVEEASGLSDPTAVPEVPIGGEFTYDVCFDHDGYSLTDITIFDSLPPEVTFVRADGDGAFGQYDRETHSYTWRDPPLSEGATTCLKLVAEVKPEVAVGTLVVNSVTIDTAQTPATTITTDAVAAIIVPPFQPLNVTKTVIAGVDANNPTGIFYANAGDRATYRICYDNRANTQAVTNVTLVDTLPAEVTVLDATGRGGQYNALTHTYAWSLLSLVAGEQGCVDLVVELNQDVPSGTAVTNHVTIDSDETVATTASAVIMVGYEPLRVAKRIKSGAVEDPNMPGQFLANAGSDLTYEICVANPSTVNTITHISIVDALPANTSFVSAERDQEIGYYDSTSHTYTWFYGSLAPGVEDCLDLVVHIPETVAPNTTITNSVTVSARQSQTTTATVVVRVPEEPLAVQCDLLLKPTKLYRGLPGQSTSLQAVVHLPQGYGRQMIVQQPLRLMPGNIPSLTQRTFGTSTAGAVMAFFDPQALLSATSVDGLVTVTVIGRLTDGRAFRGQQEIEIVPPSR